MSLTTGEGAVPFTMPVQPAYSGNGNNGGNGGWGENGSWWIILFLIWAIFGIGNNGWGGNGGMNGAATQGALTREQACIDNNFQNLMREAAGISDAVNLGFSNLNSVVCSQQYDTARMINGLQGTVQAGFNASNIAQLQGQNALATQLAQCCCENRQGQAEINYNMATQANGINTAIQGINYNLATQSCDTRNVLQSNTRDLIDNANANTRAILDKLTSQEIEAKNAQITALNQQLFAAQLKASQGDQTAQIVNTLRPFPVAAYQVCNPFTGTYGYQSYGACGCNTGCGCA